MAKAAERVVSRESFGELLAMATENVVALTRMGFDAMDLVWSNLRLAGRRDITRLARQLGRTEDKLELVLQEVERLREQIERRERQRRQAARPARKPASARGGARRATRRHERPRAHGPLPDRRARVRQHRADRARRADRGDAQGRGVDAPHDDALPLPLHQAHVRGSRSCSSSRSSTAPTSSTCARATRSWSSCSTRATTSSCSTGACPTRPTPTSASSTTCATRSPRRCARCAARRARRRRRCSAGASAAPCRCCTARWSPATTRAQPRPAHHAHRHDRARSTRPGWRATPSTSIASPTSTARCRGGPSTGPTSS